MDKLEALLADTDRMVEIIQRSWETIEDYGETAGANVLASEIRAVIESPEVEVGVLNDDGTLSYIALNVESATHGGMGIVATRTKAGSWVPVTEQPQDRTDAMNAKWAQDRAAYLAKQHTYPKEN